VGPAYAGTQSDETASDIAFGHLQDFLHSPSSRTQEPPMPPKLTSDNQGYWDRRQRAEAWIDRAKSLKEPAWDEGPLIGEHAMPCLGRTMNDERRIAKTWRSV